jgi:hypothetical protein
MESREENYLRQAFAQILLNDLMPGVIHNFANPLSNIMGRVKMLERRLADLSQFLSTPAGEASGEATHCLGKIKADLAALSDSSQYFCGTFKHLSDKLVNIIEKKTEMLKVTELVRQEAQFANFFLEYKHNVKKTFLLEEDLSPVLVNRSNLTICMTLMIAAALRNMTGEKEKEIIFATSQYNGRVFVTLRYRGRPLSARENQGGRPDFTVLSEGFGIANGLALALKVLETDGVAHEITEEGEWSEIRIALPPRD